MYKYHRIKDLREDNDLTQIQCAKLFYVSKNTYIRKEIKPTDEKDKLYQSLRVLIIIICVLLIITILWKLLPVLLIMGAPRGSNN